MNVTVLAKRDIMDGQKSTRRCQFPARVYPELTRAMQPFSRCDSLPISPPSNVINLHNGLPPRRQLLRGRSRQGTVPILPPLFPHAHTLQKALHSFWGLGEQTSTRIMAKFTIHKLAKVGSLAPRTVTSLTAELSQLTLESDAKAVVTKNIHRLKDMGTWRGRRHAAQLPVRGQRTRCQTATATRFNRLNRFEMNSRSK